MLVSKAPNTTGEMSSITRRTATRVSAINHTVEISMAYLQGRIYLFGAPCPLMEEEAVFPQLSVQLHLPHRTTILLLPSPLFRVTPTPSFTSPLPPALRQNQITQNKTNHLHLHKTGMTITPFAALSPHHSAPRTQFLPLIPSPLQNENTSEVNLPQ
jgi:hypothetical protein